MDYRLEDISSDNFEKIALAVFLFQYNTNKVYREYCQTLKISPYQIDNIDKIPFLPIQFFKTHEVFTGEHKPKFYFESSGTTGMTHSKHYVYDQEIYHDSIRLSFEQLVEKDTVVLGLLPHYLERKNSSLVYMVRHWMNLQGQKEFFYLYNQEELYHTVSKLLSDKKKVLLIGISFALLDFAEKYQIINENLAIIETGGMKVLKKEMVKSELVSKIQMAFPQSIIRSEYGMCELLSQSYSDKNLKFSTPPWMKVLVSELNDPLKTSYKGTGTAKIIDLANYYSCSFIETQDMIVIDEEGTFEIIGRKDNSDIRGCNLLYT